VYTVVLLDVDRWQRNCHGKSRGRHGCPQQKEKKERENLVSTNGKYSDKKGRTRGKDRKETETDMEGTKGSSTENEHRRDVNDR